MKPPLRAPPRPQARPSRRVELTTERFVVRTATPEDACQPWRRWYTDPEVMTPLNLATRAPSLADLQNQIASYDQERRLLLAIYPKGSDLPVGAWMIELDAAHRTASLNVMIGDKAWWGKKVVNETRAALLDFLFDVVKAEKAVGAPMARNFPAVFNYKAQGWRLEGVLKAQARSLSGAGPRLDQYLFGLSPDEWKALKGGEGR